MSRSKFEAMYGAMGFDLTRMKCLAPEPWSEYKDEKTGYAWAGWLAGRESMREDSVEVCGGMKLDASPDQCAEAILRIEP